METTPNKSFNGSFNGSFVEELDQTVIPLLPEVSIPTNEENEDEIFKIRAKLFRYDSTSDPHEWKERGTGDVKLLRNRETDRVRVVMRRDRTLKICANHFIVPCMDLRPCMSSDRAWVYSAPVDFADEKPTAELLAIKFANTENAKAWKTAFDNAKEIVTSALKNEPENEKSQDISTETDKKIVRRSSSSSLSESSESEENEENKEEPEATKKVDGENVKKEDSETTDLAKDLENTLKLKLDVTSTPNNVGDST